MASYSWYKFSELTVEQLYSVLKLRADVFVVEQDGAYLDPDWNDIFDDTEDCIVFGRVATARTARRKGYGKQLMQELVTYCDINFAGVEVKCSARDYLKKFYESFGFKVHGSAYEEDGFPHLAMQRCRP